MRADCVGVGHVGAIRRGVGDGRELRYDHERGGGVSVDASLPLPLPGSSPSPSSITSVLPGPYTYRQRGGGGGILLEAWPAARLLVQGVQHVQKSLESRYLRYGFDQQ